MGQRTRPRETVHRPGNENQGSWLFGPIFKVASVVEITYMTEWFKRAVRVDRRSMGTSAMGLS